MVVTLPPRELSSSCWVGGGSNKRCWMGGSWKQHTLEPPTILATAGHDKENTKKNTKTRNKTKINATLATAVPATQEKTRTKNARMKVEL